VKTGVEEIYLPNMEDFGYTRSAKHAVAAYEKCCCCLKDEIGPM
jgi:hypothetical protein